MPRFHGAKNHQCQREKERAWIRIRRIVAERGEKDGERTKRGGWSETEMKGRNRGKGK